MSCQERHITTTYLSHTTKGMWEISMKKDENNTNVDTLLMENPTNYINVMGVAWTKKYIKSLTDITAIIVSQDPSLVSNRCTLSTSNWRSIYAQLPLVLHHDQVQAQVQLLLAQAYQRGYVQVQGPAEDFQVYFTYSVCGSCCGCKLCDKYVVVMCLS